MLSTENTTNAKKIVEGTCDVTRVASQRKRLTVARVPGKVDDVNTVRVVKNLTMNVVLNIVLYFSRTFVFSVNFAASSKRIRLYDRLEKEQLGYALTLLTTSGLPHIYLCMYFSL